MQKQSDNTEVSNSIPLLKAYSFPSWHRLYYFSWITEPCAYCGKRHKHGAAEGSRGPHCPPGSNPGRRQYELVYAGEMSLAMLMELGVNRKRDRRMPWHDDEARSLGIKVLSPVRELEWTEEEIEAWRRIDLSKLNIPISDQPSCTDS